MKPSRFDYSAPTTVSETVSVLADEGSDAKILAGGQSLVPILNFRMASPARLVDINGVTELDYVRGNGITAIGAMTRLTTLEGAETSAIVDKALPHIGHRAIRNRGTLGGSLAHNDPAAELPAVLMVLDGEVTAVSSSGERTLSVTDLVGERFLETTLAPTELITEIRIPASAPGTVFGFAEFARRRGDFAIAGVAASITLNGSTIEAAAVGAFGGTHATRLPGAEAALEGAEIGDGVSAAAAAAASAEFPTTADMHGDEDYRRHLVGVLTKRALADAVADLEAGQ